MRKTETETAFETLGKDLGSSTVADLLWTVWERGNITVDLDAFVGWARENVDAAAIWETALGAIVDDLENSALMVTA